MAIAILRACLIILKCDNFLNPFITKQAYRDSSRIWKNVLHSNSLGCFFFCGVLLLRRIGPVQTRTCTCFSFRVFATLDRSALPGLFSASTKESRQIRGLVKSSRLRPRLPFPFFFLPEPWHSVFALSCLKLQASPHEQRAFADPLVTVSLFCGRTVACCSSSVLLALALCSSLVLVHQLRVAVGFVCPTRLRAGQSARDVSCCLYHFLSHFRTATRSACRPSAVASRQMGWSWPVWFVQNALENVLDDAVGGVKSDNEGRLRRHN